MTGSSWLFENRTNFSAIACSEISCYFEKLWWNIHQPTDGGTLVTVVLLNTEATVWTLWCYFAEVANKTFIHEMDNSWNKPNVSVLSQRRPRSSFFFFSFFFTTIVSWCVFLDAECCPCLLGCSMRQCLWERAWGLGPAGCQVTGWAHHSDIVNGFKLRLFLLFFFFFWWWLWFFWQMLVWVKICKGDSVWAPTVITVEQLQTPQKKRLFLNQKVRGSMPGSAKVHVDLSLGRKLWTKILSEYLWYDKGKKKKYWAFILALHFV